MDEARFLSPFSLWGLLHRWAPELQHGHWLKTRHKHWFETAQVPGAGKVISALSIANHKMKCIVPPQRVTVVRHAQLNRNNIDSHEECGEHIYGPSGLLVMNRKQFVKWLCCYWQNKVSPVTSEDLYALYSRLHLKCCHVLGTFNNVKTLSIQKYSN